MTASLNSVFAAGLFDSPWMIVLFFLGSAFINWLTKRREEQAQKREAENSTPPSAAEQAAEQPQMEEMLRRLMGEPPRGHQPPPIPAPAQRTSMPEPLWDEVDGGFQPVQAQTPPVLPSAVPVSTKAAVSAQQREAALRFEQLNEQGRHPASVAGGERRHSTPRNRRTAIRWRDSQSARQAFAASLVFGPPKSLEP